MRWMALACLLAGPSLANTNQAQGAHITQDRVSLDLESGNIAFNGNRDVSLDELKVLLQDAYSIDLQAYVMGEDSGVDDLFGEPEKKKLPKKPVFYKPVKLREILEELEAAGIAPELVRLDLCVDPTIKRNFFHHLEVGLDDVFLDGRKLRLEDLKAENTTGAPYFISAAHELQKSDYRWLEKVLVSIGDEAQLAGLSFTTFESVEVEALIFKINDDGSEDVLSAPKVTTKAGNEATIRVVQNASGYKHAQLDHDQFHQKDLANLGIRFSVTPQIIGDDLKVEGVAVLTKQESRHAVFVEHKTPVASYTCSKIVVPFSVVFPEGVESVVFDIADIKGQPAKCRLTAYQVDQRGMTRKEREKVRKATKGGPPPHKR